MAVILGELFMHNLGALRVEPTAKRIRAIAAGQTVVDSRDAMLVWEPKRVVPTYAVPERDIDASVRSVGPNDIDGRDFARIPVWDPRVPFGVRLTPGHPVLLERSGSEFAINGFIAADPSLDGYVILDFDGFDTWLEEDDPIISHPHSPFSRIDIRQTSQDVRLSLEGVPIARTTRARILFETGLPPRYYFPREDVLVELEPSDTVTSCAYKGVARYFSPVIPGANTRDLAWSYENPLIDGEPVRDYLCFFDEKLDLTIDRIERPRPQTPWS
ncbi:MAG: DUF427 domain-containing protein [Actinomycetota bacterium]|nr:DUF427 domain-containing protein [Actinomycetota bacterium]